MTYEKLAEIEKMVKNGQFDKLTKGNWTWVSCELENWNIADYKFIEKYAKNLKWNYLTWNCSIKFLNKKFIAKFNKYFDETTWQNVTERYFVNHLDEVDEYVDNVNWWKICRHANMSEDFMRMHADFLDWQTVSRWQKMSAKFIQEFADKIDWKQLSDNKKVKTKDISEVGKELKMVKNSTWHNTNFYNKKIDESVLEAHEDEIDWNRLSASKRKLSPEFLSNHKFQINWKNYITLHTIDNKTLKMAVKCKLITKKDLTKIVADLKHGDHISWGGNYYSTKPEKSRANKLEKQLKKI